MMRESSNTNDDMLFDRLVDGELPAEARRALLESLDTRPDGWRRCALAFLEAQAWGSDFGQLVQGPVDSSKAIAKPLARPAAKRVDVRAVLSWAAIAAGLLIVISLALSPRGDNRPKTVAPLANAPADSAPADELVDAPASPAKVAADPDVLTLWVRDETGQRRPIRVPLVDASALEPGVGVEFQPSIPAHVRSRLQDGGYQVHSRQRYAPLWLENGQRMVVPVEDTKIVPVSQNVY